MDRRKLKRKSVIIAFVFLLFLIGYFAMALSMGPLMLESGLTNENFYPVIISGIGIVLAIWILSDSLKPEVTEKEVEKAPEPRYSLVRRLVLFADFFLFIFLYSIFGFLSAAIIFTFLFMLFFDDKIEKVPFKIIVSVVIAAAVFLVYTEFFGVHF